MSLSLRTALVLASLSTLPLMAQSGLTTVTVSGQCNPFLAGQPDGTTSKTDVAPDQSPLELALTVSPCELLQFRSVSGAVGYTASHAPYGPEDGFLESSTPDLGISGYTMPICCLLGVFLPDHVNPGAAPPSLDFSSASSRDFTVLAPELFQTFFIGDGLRADGVSVQSFVVPGGATRLFLGVCDGFEWHDNSGSFQVDVEELTCTCGVSIYCTAKVNSQGCTPSIGSTGSLSLSGPDDLHITAHDVLNYRVGLLLWSPAASAQPFLGGFLCLAPPIHRTALQESGGNLGTEDCSGSYSFHVSHAFLASQGIVPGTTLCAQFWSRDPYSSPYPVGLTDALELAPCP